MGSLPQLSILKGPQKSFKINLLHKIFEKNIKDSDCGNYPALIFHDQDDNEHTVNYEELNIISNCLAKEILYQISLNQLKSNNDGDWIIGVCMSPSNYLIETLLSIWKSGAAYLPFDKNFPINRIEHIINESQPALIIHDDDISPSLFKNTQTISFSHLLQRSQRFNGENIITENTLTKGENELGLVLYTSGSTGIPKGVRLPHSVVLNRLKWQWERFPYSKTEKIGVFKTALTFVDSVSELWGPLLNGMAILIVPKIITQDPERLVHLLDSYKIERLVLVPTLLNSLLMFLSLQNNKNFLYNLKIWVCSGETLSINLAKSFFDYFEENHHMLCNFYGSTEVMGDVTYFVCENKAQLKLFDKVPIGHPIDNTVIYLLDQDFRPVKNGDIGELFVSGANLAHGYVNKRDPDRFIDNPLAIDPKYGKLYRTGDYASVYENEVIYEGRTDSQIKIRGHRVDLSEVEKILLTHQEIDKGVILCYHAGEIDQALLGFVTLTTQNSIIQNGIQIENYLKDKLANYMIPQIIIVDQIPLLINGKIDRQSLLKLYESTNNNDDSQIELDYDYSGIPEQQLHIAKDLFETIGQVIGRSTRFTLSKTSNFYELGGNSLNSIFTVTQLRNKGYFISITDFISAKNLGEILTKIFNEKLKENGNGSDIDMSIDSDLEIMTLPLAMEHKYDTIDIITSSFFEKADLEHYLKPDIKKTDYRDILELIWDSLVEKGLSFIVKDSKNRSIGVSLNFDAHDEPEVIVTSKLLIVFEFLEFLEGPIRDNKLPLGKNSVLHSFMMGTNSELSPQENISVMHYMENEVLKLAKRKNFKGIMTTNTSPLTQQLGSTVYGYKNMLEYKINEYVYKDGSRPFGKAPNTQTVMVHWKEV